MKTSEFLTSKIIAPLFVALLVSVITGIGSKVKTGDWRKWFISIPKTVWIILGVFIFLWFIITIIRGRVKQIRESGPGIAIVSTPLFGWVDIAKLNYVGVVWRVRAPKPPLLEYFDPPPSEIEVETPPRCPKCETQLEEVRSFWGGYIWRCVSCGFQKRNRHSYYQEADRARKIARRKWEEQKHRS